MSRASAGVVLWSLRVLPDPMGRMLVECLFAVIRWPCWVRMGQTTLGQCLQDELPHTSSWNSGQLCSMEMEESTPGWAFSGRKCGWGWDFHLLPHVLTLPHEEHRQIRIGKGLNLKKKKKGLTLNQKIFTFYFHLRNYWIVGPYDR